MKQKARLASACKVMMLLWAWNRLIQLPHSIPELSGQAPLRKWYLEDNSLGVPEASADESQVSFAMLRHCRIDLEVETPSWRVPRSWDRKPRREP